MHPRATAAYNRSMRGPPITIRCECGETTPRAVRRAAGSASSADAAGTRRRIPRRSTTGSCATCARFRLSAIGFAVVHRRSVFTVLGALRCRSRSSCCCRWFCRSGTSSTCRSGARRCAAGRAPCRSGNYTPSRVALATHAGASAARPGRPVMLATLGAPFEPAAIRARGRRRRRIGPAADRRDASSNWRRFRSLCCSVTTSSTRPPTPPRFSHPAELARACGVAVERLRVKSPRPIAGAA